jgi:alpha-aminoadipate carrier protein LysW
VTRCPECDAEIDLDEDEVEEGEILSCHECDAELEVTQTHPVHLIAISDDEDEEEDDEEDSDEEAAVEEEEEEEEAELSSSLLLNGFADLARRKLDDLNLRAETLCFSRIRRLQVW